MSYDNLFKADIPDFFKMVTVNIGRKEAVFFGVVLLVFVVAGFSMAYNSGQPLVHGHDANEIANLPSGGASGGLAFGDMEARNNEQVYLAATDGFIVTSSNWAYNEVYVGSSSSSLSIVAREAPASQGPQPSWGSMSIPVKKGLYWKVVARTDSTPIIYWVPINPVAATGSSTGIACHKVYEQGPFGSNTWQAVDIPSQCLNGVCLYALKQNRLGDIQTEMRSVLQESDGRLIIANTNDVKALNGDSTESRVITIDYSGETGAALSDDETSIGETSPSKLSVYTRTTNYITTLYACY